MRQVIDELSCRTEGPGLYEITGQVTRRVAESGIREGLLTLYIRHTSASLLIQENADPDVQRDLLAFFQRLVPEGDPLYRHVTEGPDDMPAHVRSALTQTHLAIPIAEGKPLLGTWQGIFIFEHRRAPHDRHIAVHIAGEGG